MPQRFEMIKPQGTFLADEDQCMNMLEYTSHARREPGNTNQLIGNIQKPPTASAAELWYKAQSITDCATQMAPLLGPSASQWTFVPIPGSKPIGHPEYDDRLVQVLRQIQVLRPDLQVDIRPLLVTTAERERQKHGGRLSVEQLKATMRVDQTMVAGMKPDVVLFDDVFTRGASYKAAEAVLRAEVQGIRAVSGIFIARTVQPPPADPPLAPLPIPPWPNIPR